MFIECDAEVGKPQCIGIVRRIYYGYFMTVGGCYDVMISLVVVSHEDNIESVDILGYRL